VELAWEDRVLIATVANPPVNALSAVEREGLIAAVRTAEAECAAALIVVGAGDTFIAGADIREFAAPPAPPHLPDVVAALEAATMPVIAAIAGLALGGGLEIALGCHYRIAHAKARFGLPEVTLGIVPGAGGTQRLPRLIDPRAAGEMMTMGKPVVAAQALSLGLVDRVVDSDVRQAALAWAQEVAGAVPRERRLSLRPSPVLAPDALATLEQTTRKSARGAAAPLIALDLLRDALSLPFAEGIARERATFLRLRESAEARALRHIFLAEREAGKLPADVPPGPSRPIERIGIIGAGTMGGGIAMSMADAGLPVVIVEQNGDALSAGLARVASQYADMAARGRITQEAAGCRTAAITGSTDYADLAACDLIIEAAFETMEVKRAVFEALDRVAKPGAVLASNTSYLDLNAIAAFTRRPQDVVGLHYFSPANVMRLLEIVRGAQTAPDVLRTALALAKRTGKQPVIAGVCHGFIGNRMLRAYVAAAGMLLIEGASPRAIDDALTGFGMAMGPFAVADLAGIDIGYKARKAMPPGSHDPRPTLIHDRLAEAGHLGRKTGSGFYVYGADGTRTDNPLAATLLETLRAELGVAPRAVTEAEIVERCISALAREGEAILAEGIAARRGDIDVVYVNGYGFPRHRGGPMHHADVSAGASG
jgi:3-hydroxyacyl-CoA dehydrogenase